MLALLSNCIGHIYMSVFSRFWSRAAKRRQQQANCRGGSGGAEGVDDSEFVRIEGRAKARTDTLKSAESVDDGGADQQHYHSQSEARGSPHQTHQHHQMAQTPVVIRIEQSGADNEFPPESIVKIDSTKKESIDCQEATTNRDASFSSVDLRSHRSSNSNKAAGGGNGGRPFSSIHGEADLQMCLGKPCARLRLSVQYSEQKKLLIVTLHELAQTEELWTLERREERAALQVRLALLADGLQPSKVQKFQSKFQPLDQFQVHFGQTFAFDCPREQLTGSVVRLRLYRKCREQRRPCCLGVAFLRNYLIDIEARKAQNHFLQFRRSLVEPKSAKGSMSLFPSLLSLTHSHNHNQPQQQQLQSKHQQQQPKSPPPPPPAAPISLLPTSSCPSAVGLGASSASTTLGAQQPQSSIPVTPQSASSSRRGSTVDEESGRFCSLPQMGGNMPEVLVSLCYFDTQDRLVVGVDKMAAFGKVNGQEVFVRISAHSPDGTERGKHKSECVKANEGETQFNAQTAFHMPRQQLAHSSVQVQLFSSGQPGGWSLAGLLMRRKQQPIGTLTLSQDAQSCSSADAQTHWREMIQGTGTTVDKWHILDLVGQSAAAAAARGRLVGGGRRMDSPK